MTEKTTDMTSGVENRSDWQWLENTYWYCPADNMPAMQGQGDNTFAWVVDQTVWHITGYKDGYFWGISSALLTAIGQEPSLEAINGAPFYGSITPQGQVYLTFINSSLTQTLGLGRVTEHRNQPSFEMQMSGGPSNGLVVHWANMLQVEAGDPQWLSLPGVGISVEQMLQDGGAVAPQSVAKDTQTTE